MPTIQEPNIDESFDGENIETTGHDDDDDDTTGGRKGTFGGGSRGRGGRGPSRRTDLSGTFIKHSLMTKVREL